MVPNRKRSDCAVCAGKGWRVVESEDSSRAVRCECWLQAESGRRLDRAGIPPGMRHCTLEVRDFSADVHPRVMLARNITREYIDAWPLDGAKGLLFHGPAGAGKTHLAVAIVSELVSRKRARALFVDFRDLLKTIQESWNPVAESSEKEVLRRVLDADLLALDDLGAEKPSPWVRETVAYVINERYKNAKPVIITTNLLLSSPPQDGEYARKMKGPAHGASAQSFDHHLEGRVGVPTMSRLAEMCRMVDSTGVLDYRRAHKPAGGDAEPMRG